MERVKITKETPIGRINIEISSTTEEMVRANINGINGFFNLQTKNGRTGIKINSCHTEKYFSKKISQDIILGLENDVIEKIKKSYIEKKEERKKTEQKELGNAIKKGIAVRVLEIAPAYGAEIKWARRFTEKEKENYAEWFKNRGFSGFNGDVAEKVNSHIAWEFIAGQQNDGSFPGRESQAWILSPEKEKKLRKMIDEKNENNKKEKEEKEKQEKEYEQKKFSEAKATGKAAILKTYQVECNDPSEKCSFDNLIIYAMPDGSLKEVQHHCY